MPEPPADSETRHEMKEWAASKVERIAVAAAAFEEWVEPTGGEAVAVAAVFEKSAARVQAVVESFAETACEDSDGVGWALAALVAVKPSVKSRRQR